MQEKSSINLINFLFSQKMKLLSAVLLMFLYALFENALPYSMSFIIDEGLNNKNIFLITILFIILIISGLLITFSQAFRDYLYLDFTSGYLKHIRYKVFSHLQYLSMNFYSKTESGNIISKFSTDLAALERALIYSPAQFIIPVISSSITLILLFILNVWLAIISLLIFPAFFLGPFILTKHSCTAGCIRKEKEADTISSIQTNILAQPVIKALNLQKTSISHFDKKNSSLHATTLKSLFLNSLLERSSITATIMLQVILLGVGVYMTYFGYLEVGELVSFQILFIGLTYNILYCSSYFPTLVQSKVCLQRIKDLLLEKTEIEDQPNALKLPEFKNKIQFENVSFGYDEENLNIRNLTLTIPKGSSVAFVGESGCGKSTILNLLLRFFDVNQGKILIDNNDIREVTQQSLRQQIGIVLQENILFNMTVYDNIRLGKLDASDDEIHNAAKKAEIHDFILNLPNGYNTLAGERGGKLSGGQKQRVAIARSLLHNPNILLLDEATSALDPSTQKAIDKTIFKINKSGVTIINVTHKLSSVINAKQIFVLQNGKITESGTHNELKNIAGIYKKMWEKETVGTNV